MKSTLLKFSILFFLLISFPSLADLPGGGVRWHTAFVITNTTKFYNYHFYYSHEGDNNEIKEGKTYSFTHAGSPSVDWGITIYAVSNQSGKSTVPVNVGENGQKETITIREIKNDTLYFDKTESTQGASDDLITLPTPENNDGTEIPATSTVTSTSNTTYLLIGISVVAILIFGVLIFLRRKKA